MESQRLSGRIALVTGGAQGQGEAHVRRLLAEGAVVHFADISEDGGRRLEAELTGSGLPATFHTMDVSSADDWRRVVAAIDESHGRLDVLVNNAGVLDMLGPEAATEETWNRTIAVNQTSVFLATKTAIPLLRKSSCASVINTSSIFGLIAAPDYFAYTASKGAVASMTRAAAVTYGADGIRFNSVHPGYVDTPMLRREFEVLGGTAEQESLALIPLGRFAVADDIARAVVFLASDDAAYITGTQLIIDGGVLAM